MKTNSLFLILFALIPVSLSACLGSPSTNQPIEPDQDVVATMVAGTLAAEGDTGKPTQPVTEPPVSCLPPHPGTRTLPLPAGLATGSSADKELITIYDAQGTQLGTKNLYGLSWQNENQVQFAGGLSGGLPSLPVVYNTLGSGGMLTLNQNDSSYQLGQAPEVVAITGAEGGPTIAYSRSSIGPNGWISFLHSASYTDIGTSNPLLTRDQGDGFVLYPLAVHVSNGQAQGVWYTESMYGIGNIIFAPYRDLLYLNLGNNQVTSYLGTNTIVAGFSPDQTWVAYAPGTGASPGQAQSSLILKNLVTCQEVTLIFHPDSNLGGGWVYFSPDSQMVAWLEASGNSPMDAQLRLRVAHIDGTIFVDSPISSLTGLAGGETPQWISIGGWIANHLLVLNISMLDYTSSLMVMWAPDPAQPLDPALGANQSVPLGDGIFMGFLYP